MLTASYKPQFGPMSRSCPPYLTDGLKEWKNQQAALEPHHQPPDSKIQPISIEIAQQVSPTEQKLANQQTPGVESPLVKKEDPRKMSLNARTDNFMYKNTGSEYINSRPKTPAYIPFEDPRRTDDYYKRYLQLSQNVANKYPNHGPYKSREGSVGGSWRHIKEVQGHSSRVVYVDGIVRVYDQDRLVTPHFLPPVKKTPPFVPIRNYSSGPGDTYSLCRY